MKQEFKRRPRLGLLEKSAIGVALAGLSIATVIAQAPAQPPAQRPAQTPAPAAGAQAPAPAPSAADRALMQARVGGSVAVEGSTIVAQERRFEPNNRTYWHSHDGGFILFVQEGKARVQTRGQPMKELGKGEIDYTPPGVEHWHGSAPGEPFVQLGVVPGGGGIKFLEAVTDAQYNGK